MINNDNSIQQVWCFQVAPYQRESLFQCCRGSGRVTDTANRSPEGQYPIGANAGGDSLTWHCQQSCQQLCPMLCYRCCVTPAYSVNFLATQHV